MVEPARTKANTLSSLSVLLSIQNPTPLSTHSSLTQPTRRALPFPILPGGGHFFFGTQHANLFLPISVIHNRLRFRQLTSFTPKRDEILERAIKRMTPLPMPQVLLASSPDGQSYAAPSHHGCRSLVTKFHLSKNNLNTKR